LTVRDCTFFRNTSDESYGGVLSASGGELILEESTFAFNGFGAYAYGPTISLRDMISATLSRILVSHTTGAEAIRWNGEGATPTFTCCNVWGNEAGGYSDSIGDQTGVNGNISAQPIYCGVVNAPPFLLSVAANSPCLPENNDCGVQIGAHGQGCGATSADDLAPTAGLLSVFPNPFNPTAEIRFVLPGPAEITVRVLDATGREMRRLLDGMIRPSGEVQLSWDGRNDNGQPLPSGVYFCEVQAGEFRATKKMTLLK